MAQTTNRKTGDKPAEDAPGGWMQRERDEEIDKASQTPTLPVAVNFAPPAPATDMIKLYEKKRWKDVLDVYQCANCGHCENDEDGMILHVIAHAPKAERESLFNKLIKEK